MEKDTFIFHKDWHDVIAGMSEQEQYEIYNAMCRYAFYGELVQFKSPLANGAFLMLQKLMDAASAKYDSVIEKRREAANARWNKENMQKDANGCKRMQMDANVTYTDTDNVTEAVTVTDVNSNDNNNKLPLLSPKGEIPYEFFKAQYDSDGEYKRVADNVSANVRKGLAAAKIEVNWEKQVLYNVLQVAYNIRHGQKEWTVLWGGVGTGKTTLANAIIDFYGENGMCGRCGRVKAQDITISYTDQAKFREYCQKDVLFIDEVGKENKRAAYNAGSPMAELIDYRYDHHLTTIFTTNLTPGKMAKHFDVSTMDRINERSLILNIARDKSFREDLK